MEEDRELAVMKPKGFLKPPRQQRTRDDQAGIRLLAENILAIGMLNAIVALASGEIIAGHRRYQAVMLKDEITHVPVRIIDDPLAARDIRVRRISENLQRNDLSFYDKYLECLGFREDEPDITAREIAELLHVDGSSITRYLCLDHVIEAVKQAAMEDRITMRAAYEISKEPFDRQEELLAEALAGGTERVAKARRKPVGTVPGGVKLARIKLVTPSGYELMIRGEAMTLEDAAEELTKTASMLRNAEKQNHDVKTFMALCRKRAEDNA